MEWERVGKRNDEESERKRKQWKENYNFEATSREANICHSWQAIGYIFVERRGKQLGININESHRWEEQYKLSRTRSKEN